MKREQLLEELKGLILTLRDEGEKFKTDQTFRMSWASKQNDLNAEAEKLNSCDSCWLDEQYGEWFRKEIQPNMPDLDQEVMKASDWK